VVQASCLNGLLTSSPPYKCGDSSPSGTIKEPTLNGVDASLSTACNQVLHALHVRFKSRNALPRLPELISYEFYFCLQGWTYVLPTIAFSAFSTPALTVAVSTCLEPRRGLCIHQPYYNKKPSWKDGACIPLISVRKKVRSQK
jgi:hypothetical protein